MVISFAFGDLMDRILLLRLGGLKLAMPPPSIVLVGVCYMALGHGIIATWMVLVGTIYKHLSFFVRYAGAIARAYKIHPFIITGKWAKKKDR